MPKLAIISLSERSVTRTGGGRTRLTCTVEQPAQDEIGGARQAERSLHEAGRESMERLLALYDTDGEALEQDNAHLTSKGRR